MSLFRRKARPEAEWPFDDPPNVAAVTTGQIVSGNQPILYVSHDEEDGGWQFHTGWPVTEAEARVVSLRSLVNGDSSLKQLADLPLGWVATRASAETQWRRSKG